uniref:Uncharacterized protein n=1 Tax=Anguilla anguilla TaxID=7936 RepID=A0A0E9X929_ANGAN
MREAKKLLTDKRVTGAPLGCGIVCSNSLIITRTARGPDAQRSPKLYCVLLPVRFKAASLEYLNMYKNTCLT